MQPHPAAKLFPMMVGGDLAALIADIRENGQREPIIIHEGLILDGRNRFAACEKLGIKPVTAKWDRAGTPEAFVISMNLHRRHLNESQRGLIAGKLATRTREETLIPNAFGRGKLDVGIPSSSLTVGQTAKMLNVSRDTVYEAKKVLREGTIEEIEAVRNGAVSVNTVAKKIRQSQPPQKRKANRQAPLAQSGKNPERIQRAQMQAAIWARVSEALTALTSLPLPADVVAIIAANTKRSQVVKERLARSLKWLKEFDDAWRKRD